MRTKKPGAPPEKKPPRALPPVPPRTKKYITTKEAVAISIEEELPVSVPTVRKYAWRFNYGFQRSSYTPFMIIQESFRRWLHGQNESQSRHFSDPRPPGVR